MIFIDGNQLTIDQVIAVARDGEKVGLKTDALHRVEQSLSWIEDIISADSFLKSG